MKPTLSRSLLVLALGCTFVSATALARPAPGEAGPGTRAERAEAMRAQLLARFDSDGDGRISQAEIDAAAARHAADVDANADGVISAAELETYREARRAEARARRQQHMLERFDANADGQLSAEEFAAAHAQRLQRMDGNGDGVIEADELGRRHKRGDGRRHGPRGG